MTHLICDTATERIRAIANSEFAAPIGANGDATHQPRMSLTLGAIAKARSILLSSGAAKLAVLQQVLSTVCNPDRLPVAALLAACPDTIILHSPA